MIAHIRHLRFYLGCSAPPTSRDAHRDNVYIPDILGWINAFGVLPMALSRYCVASFTDTPIKDAAHYKTTSPAVRGFK
jgi:hypothetical protein